MEQIEKDSNSSDISPKDLTENELNQTIVNNGKENDETTSSNKVESEQWPTFNFDHSKETQVEDEQSSDFEYYEKTKRKFDEKLRMISEEVSDKRCEYKKVKREYMSQQRSKFRRAVFNALKRVIKDYELTFPGKPAEVPLRAFFSEEEYNHEYDVKELKKLELQ